MSTGCADIAVGLVTRLQVGGTASRRANFAKDLVPDYCPFKKEEDLVNIGVAELLAQQLGWMFAHECEKDAPKFAEMGGGHEGATVDIAEEAIEVIVSLLKLVVAPFQQQEAEHIAYDLKIHKVIALLVFCSY